MHTQKYGLAIGQAILNDYQLYTQQLSLNSAGHFVAQHSTSQAALLEKDYQTKPDWTLHHFSQPQAGQAIAEFSLNALPNLMLIGSRRQIDNHGHSHWRMRLLAISGQHGLTNATTTLAARIGLQLPNNSRLLTTSADGRLFEGWHSQPEAIGIYRLENTGHPHRLWALVWPHPGRYGKDRYDTLYLDSSGDGQLYDCTHRLALSLAMPYQKNELNSTSSPEQILKKAAAQMVVNASRQVLIY